MADITPSFVKSDPALSYDTGKAGRALYKMTRLYPTISTSSVSLTANSSPDISFELPSKIMNLSQSMLTMKMALEFPVAGGSIATLGTSCLQRVSLSTRSGLMLCDISGVDVFTAAVLPCITKKSDLSSTGFATVDASALLASQTNPFSAILPISSSMNTSQNYAAIYGNQQGQTSSQYSNFGTGVFENDNIGAMNWNAPLASRISADGSDGADLFMNVNLMIPMSAIAHSILSIDKCLLFNEILILRFVFNPTSSFCFTVAAGGVPTLTAPTSCVVSDTLFTLAVSKDMAVNIELSKAFMERSIRLLVPYVYTNVVDLSTREASVNTRVNAAYGKRLMCVYNVVMPGNGNTLRHNSQNNFGSQIVTDYYSALDSIRLQDTNPRSTHGEDFLHHRDLLVGSAIDGPQSYARHRVTIDSWRSGRCVDWPERDTMEEGLPLVGTELTYNVQYTIPTATTALFNRFYHTFSVLQKQLTISSAGISLA